MLQRIQSLYILLACLALALVFLFDAAWPGGQTDTPPWMPGVLVAAGILVILVAGWALLLYKDRKRQLRVVLYAQVLTIVFIVALLFGLWDAGELNALVGGPEGPGKLIAVLLPFGAYVLFYLARKGIERDIAIVRSMDRLR